MEQRKLGDLAVSAIGLGAMPLSVEVHSDPERRSWAHRGPRFR